MSIDSGDSGEDILLQNDNYMLSTGQESATEKKIREALLDYALKNGSDIA